ncbi:MAG: DUF2129 domain-containing protein [Bacilli bacterium]|nr:DUF2129 domain-containing protein [Bacilli bacterium]
MVKRKGIIVYFQNKKVAKEIEKAGVNIAYVNPKANYLSGYVDADNFEKVKKQIQNLRLVRRVDESLVDMDEFSFKE